MNRILQIFGLLLCIIAMHKNMLWGQSLNRTFICSKQGDSIEFNEIDNFIHISFKEGAPISLRNDAIEDLSRIANYTLFPDGSYRFVVDQGYASQFKAKAFGNNYVAYCQNEYRDLMNGIVWGTNRILLKMKENHPIGTMLDSLKFFNMQYEAKWYDSTIYALVIPKDSSLFSVSNRVFETGLVEYAQPAFSHYAILAGYETNPKFVDQWNIRDTTMFDTDDTTLCRLGTNVVRAWKFNTGSPNIKIAVLDNGVEGTHEDLNNSFLLERDYTGYSIDSMENPKGHGTCCAGIISAANNNVGTVGIAHSCKLASFITHCKPTQPGFYDRSDITPPGNDTDTFFYNDEMVADAIYYACDSMHTDVFSCSWSREGYVEEILKSAINHATQYGRNGKGCVFVFSSGNNYGPDSLVKPTAKLSDVLAVGGTSSTGFRAGWEVPDGEMVSSEWESCYGDSLDLMAPGELVWTTCNVSDSCYGGGFGGTSAAAPHVAGIAALVLSMDTTLTYRQVFEILCSSATKVRPEYYTYSNNPSYPYGT